jgi:16S rRNA (cytosine967-C5)-methyltransferase
VHSELLDLARDERRPQERYDVVLLDAPCSGFGTVGRKVDARWSKSLEDIHELVSLQSTFLDRASEYVLPGGRLVYSTCTIDKEENEQVIFAFIARNPEWVVEPLDGVIDPSLCTPEGYYRAWPQHHAMAGAFAARLRRKSP